jgi:carbon monoxide dehydrogenase subunit G
VKISGSATLQSPIEQVFAALNDPAVLVRTIPGCQALEEIGPARYRMTVYAGVASIKGVYQGEVSLSEQHAPTAFRMRAEGAGAPGTVDADVRITLAEADGGTVLEYDADAVVGGMVGGVGQRMLTGVAKKTTAEFFKAVDAQLTSGGQGADAGTGAAATPGAQGTSPEGSTGPVASTGPADGAAQAPRVFSAPAAGRDKVSPDSFVAGVLVGAAVALLGAVVGARAARSHRAG